MRIRRYEVTLIDWETGGVHVHCRTFTRAGAKRVSNDLNDKLDASPRLSNRMLVAMVVEQR